MKNRKSLIKQLFFDLIYIVAVMACFTKVGAATKITTFNVAGISSLRSSHLEYVEPPAPEPEPEPEPAPTPAPIVNHATSTLNPSSTDVYKYRLTSFYEDECVGAGFCRVNFIPDEHGWYTYNGKLVIAGATYYMQNVFGVKENKLYFRYYDELVITIDGVKYDAIMLDTCGACYRDERLDLFVVDAEHAIDRGYKGHNMIDVQIVKKQ